MSAPPPLSKRSSYKLILWLVLAGGLLVLLSFIIWRTSISWQVHSRLAALRQAGYPTTQQELEDKYYAPVDPASNTAFFFNAAFAKLKLTNSPGEKVFEKFVGTTSNLTAPFSPADTSNTIKLLADNRAALDLLHQTPPGTVCRYPVDFSMGIAMPLPHLSQIKLAAQLLSLEAVWDSSNDRTIEAGDDLDAAFRVTDSLKNEPLLISQLVRFSCSSLIGSSLQRILSRQALSDSQLSHLADEFQREENPFAIERALAGETCTGIMLFETGPAGVAVPGDSSNSGDERSNAGQTKSKLGWESLNLIGFTTRDLNFFLTTMSQYLAATKVPFPRKLDATKLAEDEFLTNYPGHFYIFSGLLIPALGKSATKEAVVLANLRNAETALAIERYRLVHQNQLPEKLSDLVPAFLPEVPSDPFNGKLLRYQKLSTGYEVYSVGPNRVDDHGVKSTKVNGPDDITFTVQR